ncbi:MAG: hypothetical protein P4L90_04580 [Rhodopila sp.]|nr:hypothetical protein [Rhodopila sp.]
MRPLPTNKTHGIIHTVKAKKEDLDKVADILGIHGKDRTRLHTGEIHIVREAADNELRKG